MQSTDTRLANNAVMDSDRSTSITIAGTEYALLLTTKATKEIAVRPDRALLKISLRYYTV